MATHKHNVTCPACNGTIGADTQAELIKLVQNHAKKDHGMDLTADKVLEMERTGAGHG